MKLEHASRNIRVALRRMEHAFARPVFDEWVLFRLDRELPEILLYHGPRPDIAQTGFKRDTTLLMHELRQSHYATGHFFFARDAAGDLYDAFMALGPTAYVVFNNTRASMAEITQDPLWPEAQVHFVELSEAFQASPLA